MSVFFFLIVSAIAVGIEEEVEKRKQQERLSQTVLRRPRQYTFN